jgi:hypothetical protein
MWGRIGSRGIAADRDRWGEDGRTEFYGTNRGDTSTGTECPAKGLALWRCPLRRQAQAPRKLHVLRVGSQHTGPLVSLCPIGNKNHAHKLA